MKTKTNTLCLALCLLLPVAVSLGPAGCAGNKYERSTGEYIDDKSLNSRVRGALGDNPEYKFHDAQVASFRGTVQLSGFVNTSDQKRKAGEIAAEVNGVKGVENNITIKDRLTDAGR